MRHPLYRVSNVADLDNSKEALCSAKKCRRSDGRKEILIFESVEIYGLK